MPNQPNTNPGIVVPLLTGDTNRSQLIIRPQLAFGEAMDVAAAPGNPNHYFRSRFTGETLKPTKKTDKSTEITATRGAAGLILNALNGGGGFSGEFSSNTWDALTEAFMGGVWTLNNGVYSVQNGNLRRAFALEKGLLDVMQFFRFPDMEVDTYTITINAEKIVTVDIGFQGGGGINNSFFGPFGVSIDAGATARTTTPVISAGISAGPVQIDGVNYGGKFQTIKIEGKNNMREKPAIGNVYTQPHGLGDFDVTVTLTGYFGGSLIYNKFVNHLPMALAVSITGYSADPVAANNTYTFKFGNLQIPDETVNVPGRNADVMETVTLNGFFDNNGVVMEIDKTINLVP